MMYWVVLGVIMGAYIVKPLIWVYYLRSFASPKQYSIDDSESILTIKMASFLALLKTGLVTLLFPALIALFIDIYYSRYAFPWGLDELAAGLYSIILITIGFWGWYAPRNELESLAEKKNLERYMNRVGDNGWVRRLLRDRSSWLLIVISILVPLVSVVLMRIVIGNFDGFAAWYSD